MSTESTATHISYCDYLLELKAGEGRNEEDLGIPTPDTTQRGATNRVWEAPTPTDTQSSAEYMPATQGGLGGMGIGPILVERVLVAPNPYARTLLVCT